MLRESDGHQKISRRLHTSLGRNYFHRRCSKRDSGLRSGPLIHAIQVQRPTENGEARQDMNKANGHRAKRTRHMSLRFGTARFVQLLPKGLVVPMIDMNQVKKNSGRGKVEPETAMASASYLFLRRTNWISESN